MKKEVNNALSYMMLVWLLADLKCIGVSSELYIGL